MTIWIACSCGGGASVAMDEGAKTACGECACGKVLLWTGGAAQSGEPPALGISVSDSSTVREKIS